MKKITLILCLLTLVMNAVAQHKTELVKDFDGDDIVDTVRFDFKKKAIVCRLSSHNFTPMVSLPVVKSVPKMLPTDFVYIDENDEGFVFVDIRDDYNFSSTFIYNRLTGKMGLANIDLFTPVTTKKLGMGQATLELPTGEYTASWTYSDTVSGDEYASLGRIKEDNVPFPVIYLDNFGEKVERDYAEICVNKYKFYEGKALAGDFSYDQTKKTTACMDGDEIADSVYLDSEKGVVICKLSGLNFMPMRSGVLEAMRGNELKDFYVFEQENGFSVQHRTHGGAQDNLATFQYEPQSQRMRLVQMDRGCALIADGRVSGYIDRIGHSMINMLTGEYTGEWVYYASANELHSMPQIKEIAVLPSGKYLSAMYLEDFCQGTFDTYNEICNGLFNTYKEQEQVRSNEIRDPRKAEAKKIEIPILDGTVVIKSEEGEELPCVWLEIVDKRMNSGGSGTYFELRKRADKYYAWEDKSYPTLAAAVEANVEWCFEELYPNKKERLIVWDAFVSEGGLQKYIDFINEFVDDDFLAAPFGDIYG